MLSQNEVRRRQVKAKKQRKFDQAQAQICESWEAIHGLRTEGTYEYAHRWEEAYAIRIKDFAEVVELQGFTERMGAVVRHFESQDQTDVSNRNHLNAWRLIALAAEQSVAIVTQQIDALENYCRNNGNIDPEFCWWVPFHQPFPKEFFADVTATQTIEENRIDKAKTPLIDPLVTRDEIAFMVYLEVSGMTKYTKKWPTPDGKRGKARVWRYSRIYPILIQQFPHLDIPELLFEPNKKAPFRGKSHA